MEDLSVLRDQLDQLDREIVELYEKRMDICAKVADYKIANGKKVLDTAREEQKLAKVKSLTHNDFTAKGIQELFQQIMCMSRKLQYQKIADHGATGSLPFRKVETLECGQTRVVFQGDEGAYSQMAMMQFFGDEINCFHVETFRDAMIALDEGTADFAVLPIENSTAGTVSQIYDLLAEFENYIVGEQYLKVEHCLMALPGAKIEDIRTVYSHPQSLMQSARYLGEHSWKQVSMQNNAFAARKVLEDGELSQAAVASEQAAKIYGLHVLEKGINSSSSNTTRFVVVSNQKIFREGANKISICLELPHISGALYHMMSHFIYNDLNMTKIESRPIEDRNWEYRFFIDFEGNLSDSGVKNALRGLREEARNMRILGNYVSSSVSEKV